MRRDLLVRPVVHPGLSSKPVASLMEALEHLAQAAVQKAAGTTRAELIAQQSAEEAAEASIQGATQVALADLVAGRGSGWCGSALASNKQFRELLSRFW